ncbi:MAG: hypothetical protein EHM13_02365, partial [Acidobacteria bacterium]
MELGRPAVRKLAFPFALAVFLALIGPGPGHARGQAQGQDQRQQPARDPTGQAPPTGEATLSGHVIDYESGR